MSHAKARGPLQSIGDHAEALQRPGLMARLLAVLRAPIFAITLIVIITVTVWRLFPVSGVMEQALRDLGSLLILAMVIALLLLVRFGIGRPGSTIEVVPPVRGRWRALSSPATKVPSHGTHEYGQTWALDIVAAPHDSVTPEFGGMRPPLKPENFPAFGQPVFAGGDGTIVRARDNSPDRKSRNSWLLLPLFVIESALRGIGGERFVFGNLIVIKLDHGGYQAFAHLQQGSALVSVGDRVQSGQQIACCGNSGNTTEPHLHMQLMNRPTPTAAVGYPFAMRGIRVESVSQSPEASGPDKSGAPGESSAPRERNRSSVPDVQNESTMPRRGDYFTA